MAEKEIPIDPSTRNQVVSEADRVLIYDDLAVDIIRDIAWSETENLDLFNEGFERVGEFQASHDRYQGLDMICVIRRKSDGKLFGFTYWEDISKHGEAHVESNASEHGFEWAVPPGHDWDNDYYPSVFLFTPVESFAIQGYRNIKEGN